MPLASLSIKKKQTCFTVLSGMCHRGRALASHRSLNYLQSDGVLSPSIVSELVIYHISLVSFSVLMQPFLHFFLKKNLIHFYQTRKLMSM